MSKVISWFDGILILIELKLELKDFWGGSDNAGWGRLDEKEIEVEANFHGTRKRRLLLFVLSWQRNNGRSLFIVFVLFLFIFLNKKIVQTVDDLLRSGEKHRIGSIIGRWCSSRNVADVIR